MINIDIFRNEDKIVRFKVSGHAGYDHEGTDIVCSAVTAVVYAALGGLEELCGMKDYVDVEDGLESDYIEFEVPNQCTMESQSRAQTILGTMLIGLKQIEYVYGEYVTINEREV